MGRTITPKYVEEMRGFLGYAVTPAAHKGRIPSAEKFERHVMAYVVSTMTGYANEAVGERHGIQIPSYACIRENRPGGRVMVEYKAPTFQTLPDPKDYPEVAKAVDFRKGRE